ncbi:MAG: hypothetical protein O2822_05735 [Chloroflexi bacterium]|nr:hypothetical protein [Chloroflexota bacterium]
MSHIPTDPPSGRAARDRVADVHVPFIYAALGFGVLGGFSLAFSLSVEAFLIGVSASWASHAQVHGHVQVLGFAGLFIAGVALKLIPRFGNGTLPRSNEVTAMLWCLAGGVLARAIGQPIVPYGPAGAVILVAGAVLELAGALLFARTVLEILGSEVRRGTPHAVQISAGAVWLVAQAALGLGWLAAMAVGGERILRSDQNATLLAMQLYGFVLAVFSGVGLRSFPALFGMPAPSRALGLSAAALMQGGLVVWVAGGLVDVPMLGALGQTFVGGGVLVLISAFGFWKRETRFAAASQPLSWAVRGALLSLAITGMLLVLAGLNAAAQGRGVTAVTADATRHVFAIGVVTLGIVGMAQLILPEFASERLVRQPSRLRGPLFAAALLAAMALRGLVPVLPGAEAARFASMSLGATVAWIAVGAFAVLFIRARRAHVDYLSRMAKWRAGGDSLPVVE